MSPFPLFGASNRAAPPVPYLPQRILLLGEDLEVFLCQLHGRQRLQFQVGPGVEEADQVLEGVQAQAVVAVVGQMGHEDADLKRRGRSRA